MRPLQRKRFPNHLQILKTNPQTKLPISKAVKEEEKYKNKIVREESVQVDEEKKLDKERYNQILRHQGRTSTRSKIFHP